MAESPDRLTPSAFEPCTLRWRPATWIAVGQWRSMWAS